MEEKRETPGSSAGAGSTSSCEASDEWATGVLSLETPNREPQEYSRNIIGICLPGSVYSMICLLYSGVPCLGFPIKSLH